IREPEGYLLQTICEPDTNATAARRSCKGRDRITCINDEWGACKHLVQDSGEYAGKGHIEHISKRWTITEQEFRKAQNRSKLVTRTVSDTNIIGIRQMSGEAAGAVSHGTLVAAVDQKCDFSHLSPLESTVSYIRVVSHATESHPWGSTALRAAPAKLPQFPGL